jgi:hypothetical protein
MKKSLIVVLALFCSLSAQAQIRVAVEDMAGSSSTAALVAAQLNDDTYFDFTATVVTASQIDTLAELDNYDVVVLGASGINGDDDDWNATMSTALRQWVEAGHGAVAAGWFNYQVDTGEPFATDFEAIFPTDNIIGDDENDDITTTIDFVNTTHPVTSGLTNFAPTLTNTPVNDCCIELSTMAPEADDTVLAQTTAGRIVVAVKNSIGSGAGRSVYLGPLYFANAGNYPDATAALRTGQSDRLMEQAVAFAAGATSASSVPTLSTIATLIIGLGIVVIGTLVTRGLARG